MFEVESWSLISSTLDIDAYTWSWRQKFYSEVKCKGWEFGKSHFVYPIDMIVIGFYYVNVVGVETYVVHASSKNGSIWSLAASLSSVTFYLLYHGQRWNYKNYWGYRRKGWRCREKPFLIYYNWVQGLYWNLY